MTDISEMSNYQAIIRAEMDQLKANLWPVFRERGEHFVDRLDQMLHGFMEHDEDPWKSIGTLAQLGFLTMLAEWNPE